MAKVNPNYMELKATDLVASKKFYEQAFDFSFTDYGPDYAAVEGGPVQIGIAKGDEPKSPLPTFESQDLERSLEDVVQAGGQIVQPITPYPGGRRFHVLDPSGNELAIYQVSEEESQ